MDFGWQFQAPSATPGSIASADFGKQAKKTRGGGRHLMQAQNLGGVVWGVEYFSDTIPLTNWRKLCLKLAM